MLTIKPIIMNHYKEFKQLHYAGQPLLIGNVWDVISTKATEKAGYEVVNVSSHPVADMLGYADGQNMSFDEIFFMSKRVQASTPLHVSVDIEAGYTDNIDILNHYVERLVDIGICGINLEDGITNGKERKLADVSVLEKKIKGIKEYLHSKEKDIFINARTDTYTTKHPEAFNETLNRAQIYEAAGADGIFVPLIEDDHEIKTLLDTVNCAINVFLTPNLNDYEHIKSLGVHRISSGNKVQAKVNEFTNEIFMDLYQNKNLKKIL